MGGFGGFGVGLYPVGGDGVSDLVAGEDLMLGVLPPPTSRC